jgi:dynein intermediate chain
MSSLEDKLAKLRALKAKRNQVHKEKEDKLKKKKRRFRTEKQGEREEESESEEEPEEEVPQGPIIEQSNFVGVLNIPGRQKAYQYDQGVNVTKEDIRLMSMLQEEEEVPTFDYTPIIDEDEEDEDKEKGPVVKRVPEEEVEKIFGSNKFKKFIRRGSAELNDALEDTYTLIEDVLEYENPEVAQDLRERITEQHTYMEELQLEGHMCTNVQWCNTHAEWFLAVYQANSTEEHMGKVVIWTTENKGTKPPVIILKSTKKVNRAIFSPTNENIVFGGLSSGQVVMWDIKEKALPIMKTKPTLDNHNLPIYCLEMINDGRRDLLLSLSYEGKLCIWNPETLGEPLSTDNLTFKTEKSRSDREADETPLAPMVSMVCKGTSDTRLFVGTYDKLIQEYKISDLVNKNEEMIVHSYKAHNAPVSAISYKSNPSKKILDGLMISGSFDFSLHLWKPKLTEEKLHTLDLHDDYITAVDWNPSHPAMFASIDCTGKICLWDLLEDKDYPVYIAKTKPASCMKWHPDGLKLLIGTLGGEIKMWSLKKRFLKVIEEQEKEFEFFLQSK